MTIFNTHFDTSGTETDDRALVTVGVTATVTKWGEFDSAWMAVLKEFGIKHYHTKEMAQWKGEFEAWNKDKKKRDAFIQRLLTVIKQHSNKTIVRALVLPDYREVDAKYELTELAGGPYSYVQAASLFTVQAWLQERKKKPRPTSWNCLIAHGDKGQHQLRLFLKQTLGFEPSFLPRIDSATGEDLTPFSAADLIAYLYRRAYHDGLAMRKLTLHQAWHSAFKSIRSQLPLDSGVIDTEYIENFCRDNSVPMRSSASSVSASELSPSAP
ncbi:MAG: hypothetical protein ACT4P6_03335 [Gemmatimonadaceae bacterium]